MRIASPSAVRVAHALPVGAITKPVPPSSKVKKPEPDSSLALAHRLWRLSREALRWRYEQVGVPVVNWREGVPLAAAQDRQKNGRNSQHWNEG